MVENKTSGLTLIELLVTITIIGIVASVGYFFTSNATKNARDTRRKSDLGQYREALEGYYTNEGNYPNESGNTNAPSGSIFEAAGSIVTEYLPAVILDPVNDAIYNYIYTYTDANTYNLCVKLETGTYWIVCSSGYSGQVSSCSCPY